MGVAVRDGIPVRSARSAPWPLTNCPFCKGRIGKIGALTFFCHSCTLELQVYKNKVIVYRLLVSGARERCFDVSLPGS